MNMIQFEMPEQNNSMIMVIGIGGGGNNSVNYMYNQNIKGIQYMICNTDLQALERSNVETKIQLGPNLTKGLGAGFDPKIGKEATLESRQEILKVLQQGIKMVFITAGMGKGTGTGGSPVIAQICRELGILTVAVVTLPFNYEGPLRKKYAEEGVMELKKYVDIIIVVNNDKIRMLYGNLGVSQGFAKVDDVVANAIRSITNIIYSSGTINVDFADVCNVMRNGGMAIMGVSRAKGEDRALKAAQEALNSPLLNDIDIKGAKQIIMHIDTCVGEYEITPDEMEIINKQILDQAGIEANLIPGLVHNDKLDKEIILTLIITGFSHSHTETQIPTSIPKEEHTPVNVQLKFEDKKLSQNPVLDFSFNPSILNKDIDIVEHNDEENLENKENILDIGSSIEKNATVKFTLENQEQENNLSFKEKYINQENKIKEEDQELILNSTIDKNSNEVEIDKKSIREKMFEPYAYPSKKLELHNKIFYDKVPSQIDYKLGDLTQHNNNSNTPQQFSNLQFQKNARDEIVIKKSNEYTEYYEQKRPD